MTDLNGQLPNSELAPIPGGRLRKDAAAAFNAMYHEHPIRISDSYRPLGQPGDLARGVWSQWAAWERYQQGGNLAAHPGTSNHGWGTAIDLASESDRAELDRIGAKYGWSKSWSDAQSEWWHILYQPGHYKPPPADPNRYLRFVDGPFVGPGGKGTVNERKTVMEYDRLRVNAHVHHVRLDELRVILEFLAKRVWVQAHPNWAKHHSKTPSDWNSFYRGWRYQQLAKRAQGKRLYVDFNP